MFLCAFKSTTGIKTNAELTKKIEKIKSNQQTYFHSIFIDRPGFRWSHFIKLFIASSGRHSLLKEHHAGPVVTSSLVSSQPS